MRAPVPRTPLCLLACCLLAPVAAAQQDPVDAPPGLAALLGGEASDAGFAVAGEPREFVFPGDHGPHPGFRNEWWYVTGNLDSDDGQRFGFELTIFRFALASTAPESASAWRTNQVYVAHFALTDASAGRFHAAERYSRGAAGLAGAQSEPFRAWVDDWRIEGTTGRDGRENWHLTAGDGGIALDLDMRAAKPPVLHGENGLSRKSDDPGNASYYYSMSRWVTEGSLTVDGRRHRVSGLSWLDREWSTSALARDQQGWDWFALQLSDGSDLMFYSLRRADGTRDSRSAGTFVTADGASRPLSADDVAIEATGSWQSPAGGTYPSGWRIRVLPEQLELEVVPVIDNQELFTLVRYWEGAVDVAGSRDHAPVAGRGYVELTGYAR